MGVCRGCAAVLRIKGNVTRGKATCPRCKNIHRVPDGNAVPYKHRLFALEYVNPSAISVTKGRLFKKPDENDLSNVRLAEEQWRKLRSRFVPDDAIPPGDETDRLHRWGYQKYREMFHPRQLLGLELSARWIDTVKDERVRRALATNLSDLLRYQNQLCRYDTMALKVLDIFSIHGFPVGLVHAEANLLGILNSSTGAPVGSGGWANIIDKFDKAKRYCDAPFEIRARGSARIPMRDEWIGEFRNGVRAPEAREVNIRCADSAKISIADNSLDAILTDPPYFGNVQYAELTDFCYVWLRRLVTNQEKDFSLLSTRNLRELTGNVTLQRGIEQFTSGLSEVFCRFGPALKRGRPLAFTFHHNSISAYHSIAVAILDAGFVCSATLPAPAEMGGSIHINGTGSSIIDSIFVCRTTGKIARRTLAGDPARLDEIVAWDVAQLRLGGVEPTAGDRRCIAAGHLTRLAVWNLRHGWTRQRPVSERMQTVREWMDGFGSIQQILEPTDGHRYEVLSPETALIREEPPDYADASFVAF